MPLFTLKPGKSLRLEMAEQFAHALYAVALMVAFIYPISPWGAALLSTLVGVVRELEQKDWHWELIGRMDMCFWALACVVFTVVFYAL